MIRNFSFPKYISEIQRAIIQKAMMVPPRVENSMVPIYSINKSLKKVNNLEQIGTGVIVNINDEYFIFGASHVFEIFGESGVFLGGGDEGEILQVAGDRFSTKKGNSGTHDDDPVDASVFHIQSNLSNTLKKLALKYDDLDLEVLSYEKSIFLICGYRANKTKKVGTMLYSKADAFPSVEIPHKDYTNYNVTPELHLALAYDREVEVNGLIQKTPKLHGLSGGPLIRLQGIDYSLKSKNEKERQLLTGIIIEYKTHINQKDRILIGTRIEVHLKLIRRFLPDLMI